MNTPFIDLFSHYSAFREDEVKDRTVVVIDVLRATSSISVALANGAKSVIPVSDMGEAGKIAQNLDPSRFLLCGEKDGLKIEGYHHGNSPMEYTAEAVAEKTIILNTTNGSKAITRSGNAEEVFIASFLNMTAVVNKLKATEREIMVICAGWKGRLSLEDMLCAGAIIYNLMDGKLWKTSRDGAKIAFGLYQKYGKNIKSVVSDSNHATTLKSLGYEKDIAFCCEVDMFDYVPELKDGMII